MCRNASPAGDRRSPTNGFYARRPRSDQEPGFFGGRANQGQRLPASLKEWRLSMAASPKGRRFLGPQGALWLPKSVEFVDAKARRSAAGVNVERPQRSEDQRR